MDICLAHASLMDKWFLLIANMAMSWLEIAAFVVLMEDGILLSLNVKVSNSSTPQEEEFYEYIVADKLCVAYSFDMCGFVTKL